MVHYIKVNHLVKSFVWYACHAIPLCCEKIFRATYQLFSCLKDSSYEKDIANSSIRRIEPLSKILEIQKKTWCANTAHKQVSITSMSILEALGVKSGPHSVYPASIKKISESVLNVSNKETSITIEDFPKNYLNSKESEWTVVSDGNDITISNILSGILFQPLNEYFDLISIFYGRTAVWGYRSSAMIEDGLNLKAYIKSLDNYLVARIKSIGFDTQDPIKALVYISRLIKEIEKYAELFEGHPMSLQHLLLVWKTNRSGLEVLDIHKTFNALINACSVNLIIILSDSRIYEEPFAYLKKLLIVRCQELCSQLSTIDIRSSQVNSPSFCQVLNCATTLAFSKKEEPILEFILKVRITSGMSEILDKKNQVFLRTLAINSKSPSLKELIVQNYFITCINQEDEFGKTLLGYACGCPEQEFKENLAGLVDAFGLPSFPKNKKEVLQRLSSGESLMDILALPRMTENRLEFIKILLKYKASADTFDKKGYLPLHYAMNYKNREIIDLLLSTPSSEESVMRRKNSLKLFLACGHLGSPNLELLKELHVKGADPNEQLPITSRTPVAVAIESENIEVIRYLIDEMKVDVNQACHFNLTPFMFACGVEHENMVIKHEILRILKRAGAQVDQKIDHGSFPRFSTALEIVIRKCDVNTFQLLVNDMKLDLRQFTLEGCSLFSLACGARQDKSFIVEKKMIQIFLDKGFNPHMSLGQEKTPLETAILRKDLNVFLYLIEHAPQKLDAQQASELLVLACGYEQRNKYELDSKRHNFKSVPVRFEPCFEIIDKLVEIGAKPAMNANKYGTSALYFCQKEDDKVLISFFEKKYNIKKNIFGRYK